MSLKLVGINLQEVLFVAKLRSRWQTNLILGGSLGRFISFVGLIEIEILNLKTLTDRENNRNSVIYSTDPSNEIMAPRAGTLRNDRLNNFEVSFVESNPIATVHWPSHALRNPGEAEAKPLKTLARGHSGHKSMRK